MLRACIQRPWARGSRPELPRCFTSKAVTQPARRRRRLLIYTGTAAAAVTAVTACAKYSNHRREEAESLIRSVKEKPIPNRHKNLQRLQSGEEFDILVVGGGATGAGVAYEAQLRGLSVACVEAEDFGSGTSSKSTKLLWAGSRYLVKGLVKFLSPGSLAHPVTSFNEFMDTFKMVMHCFRERTYMLTMNPHITSWIPIAVPLDSWFIWPPPFDYPPAALGTITGLFIVFFKFYDALGCWTAPSSYIMTSNRVRQEFPQMDGKRMKYVQVFYEGMHNDSRTNLAIALTAAMYGACTVNYCAVKSILFDDSGVAMGAEVCDQADPRAQPFKVKAKKVIYCGGPFTDGLRSLSEGEGVKPVINGSGGTHIVLPPHYCPRNIGMVDMMTSRGSFLFFLPWEGYTLVGTTDVKTLPDIHHEVPEDEIQYLVNECERYLSKNLEVRRRDVMSAWYGIRPLGIDPNATDQSSASRDHIVSHHPSNGITFVSGGKWTTWREMAEDCVDQVVARSQDFQKRAGPSRSLQTPLIGAGVTDHVQQGWHETLALRISQRFDLSWDVAQHLARSYGTRAFDVLDFVDRDNVKGSRSGLYKHYPRLYEGAAATTGYPYLEAEVAYAIDREYAVTPADVLARRTRLAFLNSTAARLTLPRVVDIMAERLGWDEARRLEMHQKAEQELAQDFAGPSPNKSGASLRAACTADVKDIFDRIDVQARGVLSRDGISKAASELGFPLGGAELQQAMVEMDTGRNDEVSFPEFLTWWNSGRQSKDLREKIFRGTRGEQTWKQADE